MSALHTVHPSRLLHRSFLCATLLATAACATDETPRSAATPIEGAADCPGHEVDASGPQASFIDAQLYFQTPDEIDAWYALIAALRSDFDDVCGDTFCEGDFSNLESLRFRCSVEETSGAIGSCVWVFGASNEEIEPATGAIAAGGQIFPCAMPTAPGTDIRSFVQALSATDGRPIDAPLPGSGVSLFDGLAECL